MRKISLRDFLQTGGTETDWLQTPAAQEIFAALRAEETNERIYQRQADRLAHEPSDVRKCGRRAFMQLFTTSKLGLGVTTIGAGKRKRSDQLAFRQSLIKSYAVQHQKQPWLWCPVLKCWAEKGAVTAAHLFPYMHGQNMMTRIFGSTAKDDLFAPVNGIMIASAVESVFDKGFMAIVPRLPNDLSAAESSLWNNSSPKEYEIRILDYNSPHIDEEPRQGTGTWRELDGTHVEFLNDFRPRARYVYFQYCIQVLRLAWKQQQEGKQGQKSLVTQLGAGFGGTPGKYLPRNMLLAFVEELGHDYEPLLQGALDDEPPVMDENSEALLAAAANQVKSTAEERVNGNDDDSESDSDSD